MSNNAQLTIDGTTLELERVTATEGNDGFRIGQMLSQSGTTTLDPGFTNTASCESEITYIDGGQGILRYRGYPIEQLAERASFLETAYLLIYGELPDAASLAAFTRRIKKHTLLHEDFRSFFTAFPSSGHPMSILQAGIAGLGTYYENTLDPNDAEQRDLASILLLAKVPTMIAFISKRATGLPLIYPDASKSYTEDFLRMTFGLPYQTHDVDPTIVNALDKLFILHADHEQNCSTSTVRLVGSSRASIYASVAAGVGALSGPLHGGANEAVLRMLDDIREAGIPIKEFVQQVKDKTNDVTASTRATTRAPRLSRAWPTTSSAASRATRSCSTWRWSSSRPRLRTTTSWSATSTRTSTSTRACCTRRWASPRRCLPRCSPSAACPAGSRSTASSCSTRPRRSAARARCTWVRPSGIG